MKLKKQDSTKFFLLTRHTVVCEAIARNARMNEQASDQL